MTLYEQYQQTVLSYVPLDQIFNALITTQYLDYISLVVRLLTDLYTELNSQGATDFVVPQYMVDTLVNARPY